MTPSTATCAGSFKLKPETLRILYRSGASWKPMNDVKGELELEADDFVTSLDLCEFGVLDDIKMLLFPGYEKLVAELCKLNVSSQGQTFKPETNANINMIGYLLVHTREHLVASSNHKKTTSAPKMQMHWAAFSSTCGRNTADVIKGNCIILTYKLYGIKPVSPNRTSIDFSSTELYKALIRANMDTDEETILGFPCEHLYPMVKLTEKEIPKVLKGNDAYVYGSALAAGLNASFCRVWMPDESRRATKKWKDDDLSHLRFMSRVFKNGFLVTGGYAEEGEEYNMSELFDLEEEDVGDIVWCHEGFGWEEGAACAAYGNEPTTETAYCAAAILVTIHGVESQPMES